MTEPSKAVLITGCSSGIGRASALRLARSGWRVYATARRPESIADLGQAGCHTLALDVTDEDSMLAAVDAVEQAEGAVGVLINNAGYSQSGAIETVPIEVMRRQFETNVFGLVRLTQMVLPKMRGQRWGKIVNVGSMGGRLSFPGAGSYHASKYALEAISDAMRFELRGFGIDVILLEPGLITTEFGDAASASMADVDSSAEDPYGQFNATVGAVAVDRHPPAAERPCLGCGDARSVPSTSLARRAPGRAAGTSGRDRGTETPRAVSAHRPPGSSPLRDDLSRKLSAWTLASTIPRARYSPRRPRTGALRDRPPKVAVGGRPRIPGRSRRRSPAGRSSSSGRRRTRRSSACPCPVRARQAP
jgi:NAD(P)-dependent dehydrogenase (short-subunit alcohol dehydrogenase family)